MFQSAFICSANKYPDIFQLRAFLNVRFDISFYSFPGATNETLLQKFNTVHKDNPFYEAPQRREAAFVVRHYAGAVKYQAANMREKNLDLMRPDGVVGVLKNSSLAFVRELVGADPVAVFRWAILRAFFRAHFAFQEAGRAHRHGRGVY
jgi:myosin-9